MPLLLLALIFTGVNASAQVYKEGLIDKTVALIGKEMVLLSDIEDEVQMMRARGMVADRGARCEILENMLVSKLFLTQARLDSLSVTGAEITDQVENRVSQMTTQIGGEKALEEYFGKPLYKLKTLWMAQVEEQLLIQKMQQSVLSEIPDLTPAEIKKFWDESPTEDLPMIPTQYKLSQIVVYPDKEAASVAVKETLLGLRERIINGEKFSSLARMYSEDPGSAVRGGELGMASRSIYWPAFSDAAMSLKVGQVSQIVETPDGFHIIQMVAKEGDMFNARHILIKPKYTAVDRTAAFSRLDSIRNIIVDSTISFQMAAWNFSEDFKTRTNGGVMVDEMTGAAVFEKDQLKPQDYAVIREMKEGEISEPLESLDNEGHGNTIYKIIKVDQIIPAHPASFESDYNVLVRMVNNNETQKAIDEFIDKKMKDTYISIDPLYAECPFERKGWIK